MKSASYVISLIATFVGLCEPFGKKMKTILVLNFLGNFLVGTSYILICGYSGAIICLTACMQTVVNYTYESREKKIPKTVIIFHTASFLCVNLVSFTHWYDVIALAAALLFVFSVAQIDAKYYRVLYVTNSFLWIIYDFFAEAYGNLFTHIVLFAATTIAIIVRDIRTKKQLL